MSNSEGSDERVQWGQIKTLFILSFLILDIYLIIQFIDKQNQMNIGIMEHEEATIEQMLEDENIQIPKLPEGTGSESFITVSHKVFSKEEIKHIEQLKGQKNIIFNNFIVSLFNKPIAISEDDTDEEIEASLKPRVAFSEEYQFWNWNKELNIIIFFQEKLGRPVYFNQNGVILFLLNENQEVVSYVQTVLGESNTREDEKNLITPIKAIETLYEVNELHPGDEVTKVDIGFHTRIPLADGVQVFVPTWKVTVNDYRNYFVNAIEGWNFSSDEIDFLKESIQYSLDRVQAIENDESLKVEILTLLNEKLDLMIRGGNE